MKKIHILYKFTDGPFGGGNQFLKALRDCWKRQGCYVDNPNQADIILINSLDCHLRLIQLRWVNRNAIFFHRVDGVFAYHRPLGGAIQDRNVHMISRLISDATIFQSHWSMEAHHKIGMPPNRHEVVIHNAADPKFFYQRKLKQSNHRQNRVRLIAVSWSSNLNKGFKLYDYLDKNLDWSRFTMTFIGNSPLDFKNITCVKPVPSKDLGEALRNHDVYITASIDDACSNSLLEALACGLPVVAIRSGGNPELVGEQGLLFDGQSDFIESIERLVANYSAFQPAFQRDGIEQTANKYMGYFKEIQFRRHTPYTSRLTLIYAVACMYVLRITNVLHRQLWSRWSTLDKRK